MTAEPRSSEMEFDAASAEIEQLGLGRQLIPRRPAPGRASPSAETLNSITHRLREYRLGSPSVSPSISPRSVRSAPDDPASGECSMEEECEDYSCPERADEPEVIISSPTPQRQCLSTLLGDFSGGEDEVLYNNNNLLGKNGGALGRRSRSEDMLPRLSIPQPPSYSGPSLGTWDDQLNQISTYKIPADLIRTKLRSHSFSQDTPLCPGNGPGSFEHDKENTSSLGNAAGLPGDGSTAGDTMISGSNPRRHSSLRSATEFGRNSPIAERRSKSVPPHPDQARALADPTDSGDGPDLYAIFSSSSSSGITSSSAPSSSSSTLGTAASLVRVSSVPSISFTASALPPEPALPRQLLAQKDKARQQNAILSPRFSTRRNDVSAFHSPARGPKPRNRAPRSLSPLSQPAPARSPSTPPILPSSLNNQPLEDMGIFSKSEPLLPSSTDVGFMDTPASMERSGLPSPFQPPSLRARSASLSNLWSPDEWGSHTGVVPLLRRRPSAPRRTPEKSEEECEGEEEDAAPLGRMASSDFNLALQQAKRKRDRNTKPRMALSCSSLSDMMEGYQKPVLPVVSDSSHLDAISAETMMKVLSGQYANLFSEVIIVDCRYPYEYEGGHIVGAVNLPLVDTIEDMFPVNRDTPDKDKTVIIFHCEFSSERGPQGIRHLRKLDREANIDRHPRTSYPHVYLLQGGYKEFFSKSGGNYCTPAAYRLMRDPAFKDELQKWRALSKRRSWKKQKSQSFACLSTLTGKPV